MQVKDLKLTVSPQFDMGELPRFTKAFSRGMFRSGGSMAKGFSRAYNTVGKTSMYAQYIVSGLRSIYDILTKSNRTIEKGWNLATNTLRKTSRSTGMTEGQVHAVNYGFAKVGINEGESGELMRAYALQQQKLDPYNPDNANMGNKMFATLMRASQMNNRFARNSFLQQHFGMDAEKGSVLDFAIQEVNRIQAGVTESYKHYNPAEITNASKEASGFADKQMFGNYKHVADIMLTGHRQNINRSPFDESRILQAREINSLKHKDLTAENIAQAVSDYSAIQDGFVNITRSLSAQFQKIIKELGGVDAIVNKIVTVANEVIAQMKHLVTALKIAKGYIFGPTVENTSKPKINPKNMVSRKELFESDTDYQKALAYILKEFPELKERLYVDQYGATRLDLDVINDSVYEILIGKSALATGVHPVLGILNMGVNLFKRNMERGKVSGGDPEQKKKLVEALAVISKVEKQTDKGIQLEVDKYLQKLSKEEYQEYIKNLGEQRSQASENAKKGTIKNSNQEEYVNKDSKT